MVLTDEFTTRKAVLYSKHFYEHFGHFHFLHKCKVNFCLVICLESLKAKRNNCRLINQTHHFVQCYFDVMHYFGHLTLLCETVCLPK